MGVIRRETDGHVCVITIDNSKAVNCMTMEMLEGLCEAARACEADPDIRCAILTGAGEKAFTSGGDLKSECRYAASEHENIARYNRLGIELVKQILDSRLPYIAAVNGYALGAALAMVAGCDIAVASPNAVFGLPTTSLGGIPGWGCTQLVTRTVGRQCELRMLLLNEKIDAEEARRVGLISEIVPQAELMDRAMALARQMAAYPANALAAAKRCVNLGLEGSLSAAFEVEHDLLVHTNTQYNFQEGITAFLAKRSPRFRYGGEGQP